MKSAEKINNNDTKTDNFPANKLSNNYVFCRHFLFTNERNLKMTIL